MGLNLSVRIDEPFTLTCGGVVVRVTPVRYKSNKVTLRIDAPRFVSIARLEKCSTMGHPRGGDVVMLGRRAGESAVIRFPMCDAVVRYAGRAMHGERKTKGTGEFVVNAPKDVLIERYGWTRDKGVDDGRV